MRSRVRKFAHVLERVGLAMAGAASGLFVGAHVGTTFSALTSEGFLLLMMLGGAIGFYLGIDAPQMSFNTEVISALVTSTETLGLFAMTDSLNRNR